MRHRLVIGAIVLAAVAAGGAAYALYEDVRVTDKDIDLELARVSMTQRLLDADILDGRTDLGAYGDVIARGDSIVSGLRTRHPVGGIIRGNRIDAVASAYLAMQLNYAQHHHPN